MVFAKKSFYLLIAALLFSSVLAFATDVISGKVTREPGSDYVYVAFGDYSQYNYYSQLESYLGSNKPSGLQPDNNSIGFHMTVKDSNLINGRTMDSVIGKTYQFYVQTGFTLFEGSKNWYVKILIPTGGAENVFSGAYRASLHASVGYYYSNSAMKSMEFPAQKETPVEYKKAL